MSGGTIARRDTFSTGFFSLGEQLSVSRLQWRSCLWTCHGSCGYIFAT
jgi:hypothetical protein